jgi:hypothetical protein
MPLQIRLHYYRIKMAGFLKKMKKKVIFRSILMCTLKKNLLIRITGQELKCVLYLLRKKSRCERKDSYFYFSVH